MDTSVKTSKLYSKSEFYVYKENAILSYSWNSVGKTDTIFLIQIQVKRKIINNTETVDLFGI